MFCLAGERRVPQKTSDKCSPAQKDKLTHINRSPRTALSLRRTEGGAWREFFDEPQTTSKLCARIDDRRCVRVSAWESHSGADTSQQACFPLDKCRPIGSFMYLKASIQVICTLLLRKHYSKLQCQDLQLNLAPFRVQKTWISLCGSRDEVQAGYNQISRLNQLLITLETWRRRCLHTEN